MSVPLPLAAFPIMAKAGNSAPLLVAVLIGLGIYLATRDKQQPATQFTR